MKNKLLMILIGSCALSLTNCSQYGEQISSENSSNNEISPSESSNKEEISSSEDIHEEKSFNLW